MHRSATSLTTSVLTGCGWRPPGAMIGPMRGNERGHFEDRRIHRLHRTLLADHGLEWNSAPELRARRRRPLDFAGHEDEVHELVTQLREDGPWVWKNPRASLWIEAWGRALPEARVVICVRSPAGVTDSLLRRRDWLQVPHGSPLRRLRRTARALSLWHSYNLALYRFARRHPDRVAVLRVPDDLEMLAAATEPSMFDPALIATKPRRKIQLVAAFAVRSLVLHRRLRRMHDPAKLAAVLAGPSPAGSQA